MSSHNIFITFGTHRNTSLADVPSHWINWVLKTRAADPNGSGPLVDFCDDYEDEIQEELVSRTRVTVDKKKTPSQSQQAVIDAVIKELFINGGNIARLNGPAGTGKTFTTGHILAAGSNYGYTAAAMAPSRVAADNLAAALGQPDGMTINTIASVAGLVKVYNGPNTSFTWSAKSPDKIRGRLASGCILVIDEFSMVNDEVAGPILEIAAESEGKLLLIGDELQLQPIGQEERSLFCRVEPSFSLTEPQRFTADSDLNQLAIQAREDPRKVEWDQWDQMSDDIFMYGPRDASAFYDEMVSIILDFPKETTISLHSRTSQVAVTNKIVRERLYGANPPLVANEERLRIVNTNDPQDLFPVYDDAGRNVSGIIGKGTNNRVYSGKLLQVLSISDGHVMAIDGAGAIPVIRAHVTIDGRDRGEVSLLFALNDTKPDPGFKASVAFSRALNKLASDAKRADAGCRASSPGGKLNGSTRQANWLKFHRLKGAFVWVQYPYACTVHRVQGMTADNVFVRVNDIGAGRSRDKCAPKDLAYVALTRGSTSMCVCK